MPADNVTPAAAPHLDPDMIPIHRSTAKAIADIIHICSESDCGLEQLDERTLPALVYAIEWHLEAADEIEEEERKEEMRESRRAAPHLWPTAEVRS
jgi:hypothetical protein